MNVMQESALMTPIHTARQFLSPIFLTTYFRSVIVMLITATNQLINERKCDAFFSEAIN